MAHILKNLIRSSWYGADLKARIIYPLMLLIGTISALISFNIYDTEKASLYNELDLRGRALSHSLSVFASTHIANDDRRSLSRYTNKLMSASQSGSNNDPHLHHVEFYKNQSLFLSINNDSIQARIQPDTLKYYSSNIFSNDDDMIGSVKISLSTQDIDDHLYSRMFQLSIASVFFVITASILLSWLLDKIVIQPLERLSNKIQMLMSQRFNQKISSGSWDEIGNLFHNLNHLRVRLKRNKEDDISNLEQDLDRISSSNDADSLSNQKVILIVDDDELIRLYLEKLLNNNDIATTSVDNGYDALKLIYESKFDLVLLDIHMPGISGYEVLNRLQYVSDQNHPPVIVVSSNQEKGSIVKALTEGAVDYVIKPFDKEELIARINIHMKSGVQKKELERIIEQRISNLKKT